MTHRELQDALDRMKLPVDAALAHGWLCGALCARTEYGAGDWLRELAADSGAVAEPTADATIGAFLDGTLAALRSPDCDFAPLLPEDDAPLAERVAALADWCSGFLDGIGQRPPPGDALQAGEIGEYLGDLSNIARAELEAGREPGSGERDFMELCEFVRVGAQVAWLELAAARSHAAR